jgi:hypothetical protein
MGAFRNGRSQCLQLTSGASRTSNITAVTGAEAAAARLVARQEAVPVILLGGTMIDEAIDGLVRDDRVAAPSAQAASDLLGRPALEKVLADEGAELGRGGEFVGSATLTTPLGQLLSAQGIVATLPGFGGQGVSAQLAGNGGGGVPEGCRDDSVLSG